MHPLRCVGLLLIALQSCLIGCVAAPREPQFTPQEIVLAGRAEVPLEFASVGYPFVTVTIDGRPARLMVDTGAAANLLTTEFVKGTSLVVEATSFRSVDATGTITASEGMTRARTVTFPGNSLFLKDVDFLVDPLPLLRGLDGVIGMPAFASGLVTLDLARQKLVVEQGRLPAIDHKTVIPLVIHPDGRTLAPVEVAGHKQMVCFDSGYTSTIFVPERLAAFFPGAGDLLPFGVVRAWTGPIRQGLAIMRSDIGIGQYHIRRASINVGKGSDIAMGVGVMRRFVMTFDQRGRRLRLIAATPPAEALLINPLPLPGLDLDARSFKITSVARPSVASLLGLRVGDELVSVEGVTLAQFGAVPMPKPKSPKGLSIVVKRNGKPFTVFVPTFS
jgi:hypothetical protein